MEQISSDAFHVKHPGFFLLSLLQLFPFLGIMDFHSEI